MFALSGLTAKVLAALSRSGLAIGTDAHPVISATIAATAIINQRDMFFIFLPLYEVVVYPSRTGPSNVLRSDESRRIARPITPGRLGALFCVFVNTGFVYSTWLKSQHPRGCLMNGRS